MSHSPHSSSARGEAERLRRERFQAALRNLERTLLVLGVDPSALPTQAAVLEQAAALLNRNERKNKVHDKQKAQRGAAQEAEELRSSGNSSGVGEANPEARPSVRPEDPGEKSKQIPTVTSEPRRSSRRPSLHSSVDKDVNGAPIKQEEDLKSSRQDAEISGNLSRRNSDFKEDAEDDKGTASRPTKRRRMETPKSEDSRPSNAAPEPPKPLEFSDEDVGYTMNEKDLEIMEEAHRWEVSRSPSWSVSPDLGYLGPAQIHAVNINGLVSPPPLIAHAAVSPITSAMPYEGHIPYYPPQIQRPRPIGFPGLAEYHGDPTDPSPNPPNNFGGPLPPNPPPTQTLPPQFPGNTIIDNPNSNNLKKSGDGGESADLINPNFDSSAWTVANGKSPPPSAALTPTPKPRNFHNVSPQSIPNRIYSPAISPIISNSISPTALNFTMDPNAVDAGKFHLGSPQVPLNRAVRERLEKQKVAHYAMHFPPTPRPTPPPKE